jgi:hypothetical protein
MLEFAGELDWDGPRKRGRPNRLLNLRRPEPIGADSLPRNGAVPNVAIDVDFLYRFRAEDDTPGGNRDDKEESDRLGRIGQPECQRDAAQIGNKRRGQNRVESQQRPVRALAVEVKLRADHRQQCIQR